MLGPLLLKANTLQLFTKEAGLARALDKIPSVRITEGVNQTGLLLLGEGHSRREYMFHPSKNLLVSSAVAILIGPLTFPSLCAAEWTVQGESYLFYTEDAALFSATRRLTRDQDPTQPVIDRELAEQGDDVVYEPAAQVTKSFSLLGGHTELLVRGQGYVFFDQSRFDHGTLGVQAVHEFPSGTNLIIRYYFSPDLLVGENEVRHPEGEEESEEPLFADETVTTNYLAFGLGQRLRDEVTLKLYSRIGIRRYNDAFQQRDTDFWTIGTHLEWDVSHRVDLMFGYHYERGLADGRNQPALKDDVSYFNHFATAELEVELMKRLGLEAGIHYEFNGWTTGIVGDERNGEHEQVVVGDIGLLYELTEAIELTAGFQGAYRKESFEDGLRNLNAWVGGQVVF